MLNVLLFFMFVLKDCYVSVVLMVNEWEIFWWNNNSIWIRYFVWNRNCFEILK